MTYEQLQKELQQSMKDKNRVRKNVIADMITCAKNMAIAKGTKDNITEDIVDAAILKSKKICMEQIATCPDYRPDLMEGFMLCMVYIEELAPKMMDEEEIRKAVYHIIATVDIQEDTKGALMKAVMLRLKGKADGKLINKIVTEIWEKENHNG